MATYSSTLFEERRNGRTVLYLMIHQRHDGYLKGEGRFLATFLKRVQLVSSRHIFTKEGDRIVCSGFGDLVARYLAFKRHMDLVHWPDEVNVQPADPDCKIDDRFDFVYNVVYTGEDIFIRVHGNSATEERVYNQEISVDELAAVCGTSEHSTL